jgi:speckle-type POZ protein
MVTKTSSVVVVHAGEHLFKIVGHSQIRGSHSLVRSGIFRVGDHDWTILYYPNGDYMAVDDQFAYVFLLLMNAGEDEVTASFDFSLQDPTPLSTGEKHKYSFTTLKFSSTSSGWGTGKFVSKADLAASGYLKDDCLLIKCVVNVPKLTDDIIVPPSHLAKDLGNLLDSGINADMTVKIGSFKAFKVHTCVLAARSPVFRAQLCGSMMESRENNICIDDIDAEVFEVVLHYLYKDCLPEFMEENTEDATNMVQHLLVAADMYAMERLKLMCESKLSKTLDTDTVGITLDLAEQYNCEQLKSCCIKYMARSQPLAVCGIPNEVTKKLDHNDLTT